MLGDTDLGHASDTLLGASEVSVDQRPRSEHGRGELRTEPVLELGALSLVHRSWVQGPRSCLVHRSLVVVLFLGQQLDLVVAEAVAPAGVSVDVLEAVRRLRQPGNVTEMRDRAVNRVTEHGHEQVVRGNSLTDPRSHVHREEVDRRPSLRGRVE